jgi:hypothetical protein
VDQTWKNGALAEATIRASRDDSCTVRTRGPVQVAGTRSRPDGDTHTVTFATRAGETYRIVASP